MSSRTLVFQGFCWLAAVEHLKDRVEVTVKGCKLDCT